MSVLDTDKVSKTVVRDEIRDGLRTAAGDSNRPLTDPKSGSRPSNAEFVLTSHPDRDAFYPLIIVGEDDDSAEKPDQRATLFLHDYVISITIKAESSTNLFKIRDQVKNWLFQEWENLGEAGIQELEVISSSPEPFNEDARVQHWKLRVGADVYSSPA